MLKNTQPEKSSVGSDNLEGEPLMTIYEALFKELELLEIEEYCPAIWIRTLGNGKTVGVMGGNDDSALGLLAMIALPPTEYQIILNTTTLHGSDIRVDELVHRLGSAMRAHAKQVIMSCFHELPSDVQWFNIASLRQLITNNLKSF